ncbi:amidohydrolase family protein [Tautonia marina]|uniref:amidohydrolase family protein n=1 Tax=Tautonia marina TaxID=2653855 RepID=UPI00126072D8|nr:amidohydrolase family protein [Tautonia marina]
MIDTNASLGHWPFRRLPLDDPRSLARRLRSLGIERAWVGHLDALLHRDIAAVNVRLSEMCERFGDGLYLPFGAINPTLPDWSEDLRRCQEVHRMPGIRLHPDLHGYALSDPVVAELLAAAATRSLVVQIAVQMEDPRTKHPRLELTLVDLDPVIDLAAKLPQLRLMLLNAGRILGLNPKRVLGSGSISIEIASMEGVGAIDRLIENLGSDRIHFGTHAPLFVPESAVLKLRESVLDADSRQALTQGNALRLIQG